MNRTNRRLVPSMDLLEGKISLSSLGSLDTSEVPSNGPVSPGTIIPTLKPISTPGVGNPATTNPQPLPPEAPPLPAGDYNLPANGGLLIA